MPAAEKIEFFGSLAIEQLLALDGGVKPGRWLAVLLLLEVVEPGVEHLDRAINGCLVLEADRVGSFEECRELLGERKVSFEAACCSDAAFRPGIVGKLQCFARGFVLAHDAPTSGQLEPPKENERLVRWKRFTALRKASSNPHLFEPGSM